MTDVTMRCARCGRPIERNRVAAYLETLPSAAPADRLCAACATAAPARAPEAIRTRPPRPSWAGQEPSLEHPTLVSVPPSPAPPRTGPKPPEAVAVASATEAKAAPETAPETAPATEADEGQGRSPEEVLDEILREVKHIARNQEYQEFSIWNIFGGLVQIVVLFLLFLRFARGSPELLWAVVLQVLALTLFILAKR